MRLVPVRWHFVPPLRGSCLFFTFTQTCRSGLTHFAPPALPICAAPPGLLSLFYLHPDLPVWANSFRASGAAHLCRPSGALVSFLTFTQTCRSGLTHFAPPALRSGRKSDASKHLIRQADRNGGKLTHRNTVIRQADCNGRKLMHRNISSVRKIAVAES
jgi:hypothetical protein